MESALEVIISTEREEFANDEFVVALLQEKWDKFAKRNYLRYYLWTVSNVLCIVTL